MNVPAARPAIPDRAHPEDVSEAKAFNGFWNEPEDTLFSELGATRQGLSSEEAKRRLREYGPNDATARERRPAWVRFIARFRDPLVMILLFASAVSGFTGDFASFVIIATIVTLSVTLDFVQESRALNALDALKAKVALRSSVLRDGKATDTPVGEIAPGDVAYLCAGDVAPADGRVLLARDFFVNQALLTGEPYPVEKHAGDLAEPAEELSAADNAVFAGTSVVSGSATVLICRTGRATAVGDIAASLAAKAPPTAFELGVQRFGLLILRITVVIVLLVLAESIYFRRPWLDSLLFALALAVGITPELLPMILTVTLSRGAVRLARKQVVVKRLPAIHNLGAMDVLCTDKTGTLTEARIELVGHVDRHGEESARVLELAYVNSRFETGVKSPLDDAILAHSGPGVEAAEAWSKIDEVPFDFERRRVSILAEKAGERLLVVKGAPENVLGVCAACADGDGGVVPMTAEQRAAIGRQFDQLSTQGFRVLAIATRREPAEAPGATIKDEADLVFEGFAVFLDPPKASAQHAVKALIAAGVAVKIITGDNELVARHVCEALNIPVHGVLLGRDLDAMSDEALLGSARRRNLFCRLNPHQKLRVIHALKRLGLTVGYLGDGVNDAPSLHAADVGISVDSGADVAKAASEVVLLEHDLGVLRDGVLEGRRTVLNVNKYILMASSANFGNIISMAIAGLFLPFLPLLPIQVLLTNLIYDLSQFGLPLDRVDPEAVKGPVHWDIRQVRGFMIAAGPVSSLFDMITFAILLLILHAGMTEFRTGWFIESLISQILMIFVVRTRRRPWRSRPHPAVTGLALGMATLTVVLPLSPTGRWFHFGALPLVYFGYLAVLLIGFLAAMEAVKEGFFAFFAKRPSRGARPGRHIRPAR
jgi:Mg2+-importing ATPase